MERKGAADQNTQKSKNTKPLFIDQPNKILHINYKQKKKPQTPNQNSLLQFSLNFFLLIKTFPPIPSLLLQSDSAQSSLHLKVIWFRHSTYIWCTELLSLVPNYPSPVICIQILQWRNSAG
ncbi:hypothetical protein Csa_002698 [Cucumis sativus]|uniref:Uncharacterized protein n=1 Tax=Cucumis sativus TaxID=3659 RepID=A0A0A0LEX4_CUCSA|nr:hypothetical protein Csa_002698 [Cucumis sativus]